MDTEVSIINNRITTTDSTTPPIITGIGIRLKSVRESMHLSQKEAATRLYLNVKIIEILENEAFNEGPPPTFMRGYLNSYARLLNVPENEINAALKQLETNLSTQREIPPPILKERSFYPTERYLPWTTAGIAFILIVLVSMWWRSHSKYEIADVPAKTAAPIMRHFTAPKIMTSTPLSQDMQNVNKIIPTPPPLLARPTNANSFIPSPAADISIPNNLTTVTSTIETSEQPPNKKYQKTKGSKKHKNIVMSLPEPN